MAVCCYREIIAYDGRYRCDTTNVKWEHRAVKLPEATDPMPWFVPSAKLLRQSLLVRSIFLLLLWLLVWEIGWLVEYTHHASVWYPVAGLTFAALLLMGLSAVPALLVGCVGITFYTAAHYQIELAPLALLNAGIAFGFAHIMPYALGALALRALTQHGIRDITTVIVCFLLIAAGSSLLATVLVLPTLVITDMMPLSDVEKTWLPFWIGDMAGVLVLGPFFVGLLSAMLPGALFRLTDMSGWQTPTVTRKVLAKVLVTALLLSLCMWLAYWTRSANSAFAIFFLVIPHMWIACSESPLWNATSVALSSFLIAFWVHLFDLMDFVMVYQFAICVIGANTLFGLAVPTLLADNLHLRRVAFTDALTQVASRDRLEQRAALEVIRCQQEQRPLALMVFDIDFFKQINDEFGHHVGDQALQQLCRVVQQNLRPTDTLGRFGGDEFVVLLPQTSQDAAALIAERIIEQLQAIRVADVVSLTASFGVAALQLDEDYEGLFRRADHALYQAKMAGRNRVAVAAM